MFAVQTKIHDPLRGPGWHERGKISTELFNQQRNTASVSDPVCDLDPLNVAATASSAGGAAREKSMDEGQAFLARWPILNVGRCLKPCHCRLSQVGVHVVKILPKAV